MDSKFTVQYAISSVSNILPLLTMNVGQLPPARVDAMRRKPCGWMAMVRVV